VQRCDEAVHVGWELFDDAIERTRGGVGDGADRRGKIDSQGRGRGSRVREGGGADEHGHPKASPKPHTENARFGDCYRHGYSLRKSLVGLDSHNLGFRFTRQRLTAKHKARRPASARPPGAQPPRTVTHPCAVAEMRRFFAVTPGRKIR
jgi:hypothetical protein